MNETWTPKKIIGYSLIVQDPDLLGGKPAVLGTRMSVSLVLQLLSEGMDVNGIIDEYGSFPKEAISEVLRFASQISDNPNVAA